MNSWDLGIAKCQGLASVLNSFESDVSWPPMIFTCEDYEGYLG